MRSFSTLYYPYIEFHTPELLTNGLLFWDRIGRIKPKGYQPKDSDIVKKLQDQLNFVTDLIPSEAQLEIVGRPFSDLIANHSELLRVRYSLEQISSETTYYLGNEKVSDELSYQLGHSGLARTSNHNNGTFMEAHPKIIHVYMTALAEKMASDAQHTTLADSDMEYLAINGGSIEQIASLLLDEPNLSVAKRTAEQIEIELAFFALETVLPRDGIISVDKLIKFRKNHHSEFVAYQEGIRSLVGKNVWIGETATREQMQAHLADLYGKHIEPGQKELKKALKSVGVETVKGIAQVKMEAPALLAGMAALGGTTLGGATLASLVSLSNPVTVAALAGGVALGFSSALSGAAKQIKDVRKGSTAAYLQDVEEAFSPALSLTKAASTLRKFTHGV